MNNNDTGSEDRHLIVKIVSDESFREYEGFDIANTTDETHSKSKLVSYRIATTKSYESFKQDVIDRVGSLGGADIRFWIMRRRINQTIRPSDILVTDIKTWRTQANSRSLLLYVEPVTDNTRRRLLFRREPDSTLIFLKYFNVAKQRLYGVGKTYISGRRGTRHLIDDIHRVMGWTDRRTLLLYEEIKPGMIQRLPLDRTLAQNEITNGDVICFQEYLKPEEKQFLSRQFPSFIVDAVHFYAEMRKGSFRNTRALARVFDFSVQPGETFNDAIKRTQERMGLLDKDLTNYQFSCAAGGEEGSSAVNNFNSQMNCGICMDVFVDPVSFIDCMHLSCGACAVEWFSKSDTCPQCRKVVHNVSYNHHTAGVVEAFQNLLPGSSAGGDRTIAELTAMRSKYRPGQVVVIQKPAELEDEYDEEFTDYTGEDMSELDGESEGGQSSVNTDLAIAMVESVQERPISIAGCPCCNLGNDRGYLCPNPIPNDVSVSVSAGHTNCAACEQKLPVIPSSTCCAVCSRTACPELGPAWTCRAGSLAFPIQPLGDIEFASTPDPSLLRYFTIEYERKALVTYVRDQKLTAGSLSRKVLQHYGGQSLPRAPWHGPGKEPLDPRVVKVTDQVCYSCAKDLVAANLFDWWRTIRPTLNGHAYFLPQTECKFGVSCSQAQTDMWHARINNHICSPTAGHHPNDRRVQTGAREDGNRMVCEILQLQPSNPFPFGPSEVQFRDKGGEPVFLCSSVVPCPEGGTSTIPGRMSIGPDRVAAYFAFDDSECESQGTVRILIDTQNMCWVRTSKGLVPMGSRPVIGGVHRTSGDALYHCAVWWKGQRVPGFVRAGQAYACITWAGRLYTIEAEYELLCWRS